MADNITLNSGSGGATLAADDIAGDGSGPYHQYVKLVDGTSASTTVVATGNGTSANALRVTMSSDSTGVLSVDDNGSALTVDNGGTFAVQVDGAALTALQLIDDAVYTSGTGTPSKGVLMLGNDGTNPRNIVTDGSGQQYVVNSGTFATQAAQSGTWNINNVSGTVSLPTGAATAANQSTGNAALSAIQTAVEVIDNAISGSEMQVDVVASLPAGDNNIGNVDVASALPAGSNVIGDVGISGARTSGGTTIFRSIDLDESEEQVKGTAGQVYWVHAMNLAATKRYLKFYNATAASVTVGTTTPVLTFALPTTGDTNGAGFNLAIPNGIAFSTAITVAATTGVADSDTGAPGANEVIVNLGYA